MSNQIPKLRYSIREKFKRCPRLVFFENVANVVPKHRVSNARNIGHGFHDGLESWRNGVDADRAIDSAVANLRKDMTERDVDPDLIDVECARLTAYLVGYTTVYASDLDGKFEVEKYIEDSTEHGTIDALWTDPVDGKLWLVEDKTRTQLTPNLDLLLRMNEQLLSYVCMLKVRGTDVAGCIYRETKKTQTRPKKGETIVEYCERVIDLYNDDAAGEQKYFVESRVTFTPAEIEKYMLEKDHQNGAIAMCLKRMHNFDQWAFNGGSCNGKYGACDYIALCATGSDMVGQQFTANPDVKPLDGGKYQKQIWGSAAETVTQNDVEMPNF